MDYEALEKAIMPKIKAIITVDLSGIVCNYAKVF
jgi:Predicted pyridoxal phosphate-dependent enzyme apparently involved in regulation of cell wall biogenesis